MAGMPNLEFFYPKEANSQPGVEVDFGEMITEGKMVANKVFVLLDAQGNVISQKVEFGRGDPEFKALPVPSHVRMAIQVLLAFKKSGTFKKYQLN